MEDLINAVSVKHSQNLSYRKAASMFHVPKSTLYLYDTGKIEVGAKQGPPTVLTAAEEEKLVQYAVHMSRIGYGRTKEQILDVVQALVKKDGRPNPLRMIAQGKGGGSYSKNVILRLHLGCLNTSNCHVPDAVHLK